MNKKSKPFLDIAVRYILLIAAAFPNLFIFYAIFTPLTIYLSYFMLDIFFDATLNGNIIQVAGVFPIEIIKACVAGSAYYLLLILNLSTPKIKINKRIKMLAIAFASFLVLNLLRIFLLSLLFMTKSPLFEATHLVFWYLISIVFVVGIWFVEVKIFNIKEIPFYSDLKSLYKNSVLK
jgi:exosortase/archaeosortase family protein